MEPLKQEFIESLRALPQVDAAALVASLDTPPSTAVRINRRKCPDIKMLGYEGMEPVKWCESGYYLAERPNFTLNPLLHAGVFYVQDASSMVYECIVRMLIQGGILPSAPKVLDLCAAPGGKTTAMINALPDAAEVTANEYVGQRARILVENLLKWGFPNIKVTNSPTSAFAATACFDLVAVDAPCSGEGMMRKDEEARRQWSPDLVEKCALLQREIIADAASALAEDGIMIYSTCTFNRAENEDNVAWAEEHLGMERISLKNLADEYGIPESEGCLRFMPHITRGEGLFVSVLRRRSEVHREKSKVRVICDGYQEVEKKKTPKGVVEMPHSEWALSCSFPRRRYPEVELSLSDAIEYLRCQALRLPIETPKGYVVVTYQGVPLGFVKNIGNRANNLYPAEWRIRKQV